MNRPEAPGRLPRREGQTGRLEACREIRVGPSVSLRDSRAVSVTRTMRRSESARETRCQFYHYALMYLSSKVLRSVIHSGDGALISLRIWARRRLFETSS